MLDLYEFSHEGYRNTRKEGLLELLAGAADYDQLRGKSQPELASIFAERSVYGFQRMAGESRGGETLQTIQPCDEPRAKPV